MKYISRLRGIHTFHRTVFGHIEREIKTRNVIVEPQEYRDIIANHSTVIRLGSSNCQVLNVKAAVEEIFKPPG